MQARAVAHANIALAKYWGKREVSRNLPAVSSLSMTLEALQTLTTVRFDAALSADELLLNGEHCEQDLQRVSRFLDRVRTLTGTTIKAHVQSENNFPTGAGLASSASGFAALALAATSALGCELDFCELSRLARCGSVSAARSLWGGFVEMHKGTLADASDAYASPVASSSHWPLKVLVAVTSRERKAIGSTRAMMLSAETSPFFSAWVDSSDDDVTAIREAVTSRDFERLAAVSESSCLKMHGLMLATSPALIYWNRLTIELIHRVRGMRERGLPAFFTIDAGPQVKVICEEADAANVRRELECVDGVIEIIESGLGPDARLVE